MGPTEVQELFGLALPNPTLRATHGILNSRSLGAWRYLAAPSQVEAAEGRHGGQIAEASVRDAYTPVVAPEGGLPTFKSFHPVPTWVPPSFSEAFLQQVPARPLLPYPGPTTAPALPVTSPFGIWLSLQAMLKLGTLFSVASPIPGAHGMAPPTLGFQFLEFPPVPAWSVGMCAPVQHEFLQAVQVAGHIF